jgi:hypothetical protein
MTLMRLVIVTEFEPQDHYQWYMALKKYQTELGIKVTALVIEPVHRKLYPLNDSYWQPLREADAIFVYATRIYLTTNDWWELPKFVKQFMRQDAKMIDQYDDDFWWLFDPQHVWWDTQRSKNPEDHGGPEQFFKDTGILEIADTHLTVISNPPFKKYTIKPTVKLLLPQLERYKLFKYSEKHKIENVAILYHSINKSSISGIIENVIKPNNYPITIFLSSLRRVENFGNLPVGSQVFPYVNCESYVDLLWQNASIGLDDNTGYYGWSRFVMECAIAYIPCVGSTEAVQDLFPELYTAPQDYVKQIELIELLRTNQKFYHQMAEVGHKRCLETLSSYVLCKKLIEIFAGLGTPRTGIPLLPFEPEAQASPHPR